MDAFAQPLSALYTELGYFVRTRDARVLHVSTDAAEREAALSLVMDFEFHADNRAAFVRLEAPHSPEEPGWSARASALRAQYDERRAGMARHGYILPALSEDRPPAPSGTLRRTMSLSAQDLPTGIFVRALEAMLRARTAPLEGVVVVLAPGQVSEPVAWDLDLARLLFESASIAEVRWVLVDLGRAACARVLERLGASAARVVCAVDERAAQRELAEKIESQLGAPADAPAPALNGAAWPRVAPPASARASALPPAEIARLAQAAGVAPALLAGASALRRAQPWIMKAALAMRKRDALAAVDHQRRACVTCIEGGMLREATVLQMLLATYLAHAGQRPQAVDMYDQIALRAADHRWYELGAQALMAQGALLLLDREAARAAASYVRAGETARAGNQVPLAIECFRMAGQLRADARDTEQAVRLFGQAIQLASPLPPPEAAQTSAPLAARALAGHCRRMGLAAQADSLEAQAARIEGAAPAAAV